MSLYLLNSRYRPLSPEESLAITAYMEHHDPKPLKALLESGVTMSQGMRQFIADIMTGALPRPAKGALYKRVRPFYIYNEVRQLVKPSCPVETKRQGKDGAADIVAEDLTVGEGEEVDGGTVKKAYQRYKKKNVSIITVTMPKKEFQQNIEGKPIEEIAKYIRNKEEQEKGTN
jgi:hypothetical protein